jgi:hypothetical protein
MKAVVYKGKPDQERASVAVFGTAPVAEIVTPTGRVDKDAKKGEVQFPIGKYNVYRATSSSPATPNRASPSVTGFR